MSRISSNNASRRLNPKTIVFFLSLILFVVLFALIFGDKGLFEIIRKEKQIRYLKERIERLEHRKKELMEQILELKNDPNALERIAREELWLMKQNEKVIVIDRDTSGETSPDGKKK